MNNISLDLQSISLKLKRNIKPHPWRVKSRLSNSINGNINSIYTIVMPVYNQELHIRTIVSSIESNSSLPHDWIFIDDASSDSTLKLLNSDVINYLTSSKNTNQVLIINNPYPIYETSCDNLGFINSKTEFIIEIQADIYIRTKGFDKLMIDPLLEGNYSSIGGRAGHPFMDLYKGKKICNYLFKTINKSFPREQFLGENGLLGRMIFDNEHQDLISNNFSSEHETVCRGPWCLKRETLAELDFLDETNFFIGNDDHDFHLRASSRLRTRCLYVPIDIYSVEMSGSTRVRRSGLNLQIYNWLRANKKGNKLKLRVITYYLKLFVSQIIPKKYINSAAD